MAARAAAEIGAAVAGVDPAQMSAFQVPSQPPDCAVWGGARRADDPGAGDAAVPPGLDAHMVGDMSTPPIAQAICCWSAPGRGICPPSTR